MIYNVGINKGDNIVKQNKFINRLWKNRISRYSFLGLAVLAPSLIAIPIVVLVNHNEQLKEGRYLEFDNNVFATKKDLLSFLDNNTKISAFSADAKSYSFDGKIFNTYRDFSDYLENKFDISQTNTNKYSDKYILNPAGELSENILLNKDSKPVTVFEGKNGIAYRTWAETLNTFKNYEKVYAVDNVEYDNYETAKSHLIEYKLKELETNSHEQKEELFEYKNGGIAQSKSEIKGWLKQNIKRGFEYHGKIFSDYNYAEYLQYFESQKKHIIDENIVPIRDADKKSFFINLDSHWNSGGFIGPKYVETIANLPKNLHDGFVEIASNDRATSALTNFNAILVGTLMLFNYVNNRKKEKGEFKWNNEAGNDFKRPAFYNFLIYLENKKVIKTDVFKKLEKELFPNIFNLAINEVVDFEKLSKLEKLLIESTNDFSGITDTDFTDIHKILVAIKRVLAPMKINASFSTIEIEKTENLFKELLIEIISADKIRLDDTGTAFNFREAFKSLTIYNISDLFLNPANFYKKTSAIAEVNKIFDWTDKMMAWIKDKIDMAAKVAGVAEDVNKSITEDQITKSKNKLSKEVNSALADNNILEEVFGLEMNTIGVSTFLSPALILKLVSLGLELEAMAGIFRFKTFEYKIDDDQSIYYYTMVPKIPFLNIELIRDARPNVSVVKLSDSIINYLIPKDFENDDLNKVYEFNGKYYIDKENAIEDLKRDIFLRPEWYIETKKLLISIFENDKGYVLPENFKIKRTNKGSGLDAAKYNKELQEHIELYSEQLFKKYYSQNRILKYRDGYGKTFDNPTDAYNSLRSKIANPETLETLAKYTYTTKNGTKITRKTTFELDEFVNENEIINQKQVNSDDLIVTADYNLLVEYSDLYTTIYILNYYGDKKYFSSRFEAWNYMLNHINYSVHNFTLAKKEYEYKNKVFKNKLEFDYWVEKNTFRIGWNKLNGREVINYENNKDN